MCFGGLLPAIPIKLSNAKSFFGKLAYKRKRGLFGKVETYDYVLRINTRYDMSEPELEDTIIHEMIHYYILLNGLKDTSSHGKIFRRMMAEINEKYGRHITISQKLDSKQVEQGVRVKPRNVAVVRFKDGRMGIKVLPNVPRSIRYYYRNISRLPQIASVELLTSTDPFWSRYPASKSLKVYPLSEEELLAHR